MRIADLPARGFDFLKRYITDPDGIEKFGNIVVSSAGLAKSLSGSCPVFLDNLSDQFGTYDALKNSFSWIKTGDGFYTNPYSFKNLNLSKSLILLRRIAFLGVTVLASRDYWSKLCTPTSLPAVISLTPIEKIATPVAFPYKFCLLVLTSVLSTFIAIVDLYDMRGKVKTLNEKKIAILNKDADVQSKMTKLADQIANLKASLSKDLAEPLAAEADEKTIKLREAAIKWLRGEDYINIEGDYIELRKQRDRLKLLKGPTLENLSDVRALHEMNPREYEAYKMENYKIREENLAIERKKAWRTIPGEILKVGVFSLLVINSPYFSLIPKIHERIFNIGSKTLSLISGLFGAEKFIFESYNKEKKEKRPFECVVAHP